MKRVILSALVAAACLSVLAAARAGAKSTPAAGANASAAIAAGDVTISNFQFAPKTVTIKAGSAVTWTNKEGTHTVTADDGSWESPTLNAGQTFSHKFDKAGTYRYYCSFHGSKGGHDMAGLVRVVR